MPDSIITEQLQKHPLAVAIKNILASEAGASYQDQIRILEKQLAGVVPKAARGPLTIALEQLREAQRQASLPLLAKITKAVAAIMREAGIPLTKQPQAKRTRSNEDDITKSVLKALPGNSTSGLAGNMLASECGVSYQTLRKHLDSLADQGLIVRQGKGRMTTWHRAAKNLDQ